MAAEYNMKNTFLTVLVSFAVVIATSHLSFAQINPASVPKSSPALSKKQKKIKTKVEKIGIGGKITVITLRKKKFYGKVTSTSNDGFEIRDVDTKNTHPFEYINLLKVNYGDGEKNVFTGKRANPQKGWLYGLAVIGTLVVITVVTVTNKDF